MSEIKCIYCQSQSFVKNGSYRRRSDNRKFQRFRCTHCHKNFSEQAFKPDFRLRRRNLDLLIFRLLAGGMAQREIARTVGVCRRSVACRVVRFGEYAKVKLKTYRDQMPKADLILFDEMETFEHTKCKPLTMPIAVEEKTRKILSFSVGKIAAKGHLAKISRKKYGPRPCQRKELLNSLIKELKTCCSQSPTIKTDLSHHYPSIIKRGWQGKAVHKTSKGRRGAVTGQGEMKKGGYAQLFFLNHTYAMIRDKVKCLSRKTWCTVKKIQKFECLVYIYIHFHNQRVDGRDRPTLIYKSIHN